MDNNVDYNSDILNCLANLSNEEIFTSPQLANKVLDRLPKSVWSNPNITFLDPGCKTGVFLREIAKRLIEGLKEEIPDLQERINHILTKQLYGISITELTGLMSRRTLYCSKFANSKYSICEEFKGEDGNIFYERVEHVWKNGSCVLCNAKKIEYDRKNDLENHAYDFLHKNIKEIFGEMKFDVIVGNPPYQLSDGGAQKSASPIYHKFVEIAKRLNPQFITMIIPARWYSGGKGLDNFRQGMLTDERIKEIHDFPETSDCFPGQNIRGGVCYFLWDNKYKGNCTVYNYKNGEMVSKVERPLLEDGASIFIRFNEAISILQKVQSFNESTMNNLVSARKPFGLATNFSAYSKKASTEKNIKLYKNKEETVYVDIRQIEKNIEWINKIKVIVPYASPGGDDYPHQVLSRPILAKENSSCTETYLVVGPFNTEEEGRNLISYMHTRFFRFLILLIKNTQHITQKVYSFVPIQNFNESWTDEKLYKKYGLSEIEINFIESIVKSLDINKG